MNNTMPAHYETAAALKNQGAVLSTTNNYVLGQTLNYEPMYNQNVYDGNVRLELTEDSKRRAASVQDNSKADKKLDAMKAAPQAKPTLPTLAERLQQRGIERQNAITARVGRPQPNSYAALNAIGASPAPAAPKPQSVAPAITPTMTMPLGQLKRVDQMSRAGLRLVTSNDTPRPTAKTQTLLQPKPLRPASFARRHEELCQGMGAFNFG